MFLIIKFKFNEKLDPNHWVKKIQNEQFNPELIKYKHALSFFKKNSPLQQWMNKRVDGPPMVQKSLSHQQINPDQKTKQVAYWAMAALTLGGGRGRWGQSRTIFFFWWWTSLIGPLTLKKTHFDISLKMHG